METSAITDFLIRYGYFGVALSSLLRNSGVPLPGATVLLIAGALASQGEFQLINLILIGAAGASFGYFLEYFLGAIFGHSLLERFGRYLYLTQDRIAMVERLIGKYGAVVLLLIRFIRGVRLYGGFLVGMFQMPFRLFLGVNLIGASLWSLYYSLIGYFLGLAYGNAVEQRIGQASLVFLLLGIAIASVVLIRQVLLKKTKGKV